jgi:hypothetical protein
MEETLLEARGGWDCYLSCSRCNFPGTTMMYGTATEPSVLDELGKGRRQAQCE